MFFLTWPENSVLGHKVISEQQETKPIFPSFSNQESPPLLAAKKNPGLRHLGFAFTFQISPSFLHSMASPGLGLSIVTHYLKMFQGLLCPQSLGWRAWELQTFL